MNKGSAAHTVTYGPLKFTATCAADTTNTKGELAVTTTEANTYVSRDPFDEPMAGTVINPGDTPYEIMEADSNTSDDGNSAGFEGFDSAGKIAIFSTDETLGVAINTPGADCRFFGYLINDA